MTFSAVLLAGGESRRMGRNKATVGFCGKPLWQRQLQVLQDLRPAKIFISVRSEPPWLPLDTELLLDEPPSRGPLSGLTRALEQMQTSHLVVLAVDMPFMRSEQLRFLCSLAIAGRGVVPVVDERAEPLAAIYPREAAVNFAAALAGSDFSLQTLTRNLAQAGRVRMVAVAEEERNFYRSVNESNDLLFEDAQE
ncbi:MAG TPA: molybdenum cofactor guanylyltransferase [Chthoniobacterales bacterium]